MAATKVHHKVGNSVQTTNATPATIATMPIPTGVVSVILTFVPLKTGALSGGGFTLLGTFKNNGGTVTQVGATTTLAAVNDVALATALAAYVISGTNVIAQATGIALTTIDWSAYMDRYDC